jgi:predicted nucleotidyltransferase
MAWLTLYSMSRTVEADRLVRETGRAIAQALFAKEPRVKLFLFGSRTRNRSVARSDFDVGIDIGRAVPLATLERLREAFENLPILQKVDVVDFSRVDPEFARVALEQAAVLYERQPG